jgi:hypothetical protein
MSDTTLPQAPQAAPDPRLAALASEAPCDECVGSGGWFRYEPALEPAPGLLYLSCLQCWGSGRTALPRA